MLLGIECQEIVLRNYQERSEDTVVMGAVVTYWCSAGYRFEIAIADYYTTECTSSASWSNEIPSCIGMYVP